MKEIDVYKLWYFDINRTKNGVGILVNKELVEQVVEIRRKSDRVIFIKFAVGLKIHNKVSVYAPQIELAEHIKKLLIYMRGLKLDEVIQSVPQIEELFIEGDFSGHVGRDGDGL